MVKRHSHLFLTILFVVDMLAAAAAWLGTYVLRFHSGGFAVPTDGAGAAKIAPLSIYLQALPVVLFLTWVVYRAVGLYVPRRIRTIAGVWHILRGNVLLFFLTSAFALYVDRLLYSRLLLVLFPIVNTLLAIVARWLAQVLIRHLRRRGWNPRRALIVGAGQVGQDLIETIRQNPWTGIEVVGLVGEDAGQVGTRVVEAEVLGVRADVKRVIAEARIDQVFVAVPWAEVDGVVSELGAEMVDVRIVPDLQNYMPLNPNVADFDGTPLISLRETPLVGWNLVVKRLMDIGFSLMAMLLFALPMAIISALVKLTSEGPILYCQRRMGMDGRLFGMLKFRTMVQDAEKDTGPVWAAEGDDRRTPVGGFLRRTSLDELPQFVNVIKGEMSIVGPRPERPELIDDFKHQIPRYMLRHKMKAGITGWAQINGLRGNTPLDERIKYDLYYIENWSVWFDLQIMVLTVFRGLLAKNAY